MSGIRIPLTNPTGGGSLGSGISANSGTQGLKATEQLFGAVGNASQHLFDTQVKLHRIEQSRKLNNLKSGIKNMTAEYQNELLTNKDSTTWQPNYEERLSKFLADNNAQDLSPEAREEWDMWHGDYASGQKLRIARDATIQGLKNAGLDLERNNQIAESGGDFDSGEESDRASRLFSESMIKFRAHARGKRRERWEDKRKHEAIETQIMKDPWNVSLDDFDVTDLQREVYRKKRDSAIVSRQRDIFTDVQNKIIEDGALDEDSINDLATQLTPKGKEMLVDFANDRRDEDLKKKIAGKDYQSALVGDLTSFALSFDPVDVKGSENELAFLNQLDQIQNKHEKERIKEIYQGALTEHATSKNDSYKVAVGIIDKHHSALESRVKSPYEEKTRSIRDHLGDGFIKDSVKLKSLGWSDDQIKEIQEAQEDVETGFWNDKEAVTMGAQVAKMRELWDKRFGEVTADEDALKLAGAIVKGGKGGLDDVFSKTKGASPEALSNYDKEMFRIRADKGKLMQELNEYSMSNPKATYDDYIEQAGKINSKAVQQSLQKGKQGAQRESSQQGVYRTNIKLSNYGYNSDSTPDSYSRKGIGHASNQLRDEQSAAISKSLASKLGLKRGAVLEIQTTKGTRLVTYDDTVPSTDKRTGALPPTIDIYRKSGGGNSWGGKVKGVRMVQQGRDGISGRAYTEFSRKNYERARRTIGR